MTKDIENTGGVVDNTNVVIISHIRIRDPDTGEVILSQRVKENKNNEKRD